MAEYSNSVYPHGIGPLAITDQDTQYWDELVYAVDDKNIVLAQMQCLSMEHNPVWGTIY